MCPLPSYRLPDKRQQQSLDFFTDFSIIAGMSKKRRKKQDLDRQIRLIIEQAAAEAGSVNRLCESAGVPQSSVSAYLAGTQPTLSWRTLRRLLEHLDVRLV